MEESKICRKCKKEIGNARICPFCGEININKIVVEEKLPEQAVCYNCNHKNEKGATICSKCGTNLQSEKEKNSNAIINFICCLIWISYPMVFAYTIFVKLSPAVLLYPSIISLVLIILIRIFYPKNEASKPLFDVTLIISSIVILLVLFCLAILSVFESIKCQG